MGGSDEKGRDEEPRKERDANVCKRRAEDCMMFSMSLAESVVGETKCM